MFPLNDFTGYLGTVRRPGEDMLARPVTILVGTPALERYRSAKLVVLRSFTATARFDHDPGDQGVLVAHGDQGGGYILYIENGHLHLGYNEYGDLTGLDAGELGGGRHEAELRADAGETRGRLGPVLMLLGMAPFQGIDVGIDRRSPVAWPLHERHGSFRYRGALESVTYVPGAPGTVQSRGGTPGDHPGRPRLRVTTSDRSPRPPAADEQVGYHGGRQFPGELEQRAGAAGRGVDADAGQPGRVTPFPGFGDLPGG